MPTKLPRIAVVRDAALDQALASVRELIGSDRPAAAQVHDLAVKGAEALIADAEHRRRLRLELNDMAIGEDQPWDREVLRDLAHTGPLHHRVKLPDVLIAACAQEEAAGVIHYDHDFDRLAEVLTFESRWLAPPGTLD